MKITSLSTDNWRNFRSLDFPVEDRLIVVGPNASGKSNFLDLFRFLGDIAADGGGLAAAVDSRGGMSKVKSLFSRNNAEGKLRIKVSLLDGDVSWDYELSVKSEPRGHHRPLVDSEKVTRNGEVILHRPDENDRQDPELLTQTHLEQIFTNKSFRGIAEHFRSIRYFHLSPQAIRETSPGAHSNEPYGSGLLSSINSTSARTRSKWLSTIQQVLQSAVPQFESLTLEVDESGQPHLVAGYRNWRQSPALQRETEFSDGTLRLIGLLWAVISSRTSGGLLLLEEPELSLNAAIVRSLPTMLASAQRGNDLQVFMSTHSPDLLDDEGVHPSEILVLTVGNNGTEGALLSEISQAQPQLTVGLPRADIVSGLIDPNDLSTVPQTLAG
ncbi:AAA family ATPase [Corynebacterium sp.]|uniref:AAA family ATPase n=1 Tax=Corynebacterium sp. TaxID=1720 RepID=UPI0026DEC65E|nr:ATP-binding protein [Corynebacterium sp.]MDO5512145.1 AAA family ATPase [Corynebacterium sp.]